MSLLNFFYSFLLGQKVGCKVQTGLELGERGRAGQFRRSTLSLETWELGERQRVAPLELGEGLGN
jgi:hypothetical protein